MANKYNLYNKLSDTFKNTYSTLEETSFDDENKCNLCNDKNLKVFDFDKIKDMEYRGKKGYKSPDAIYIRNKEVFIIEFKNQNPCNIDSQDLKDKLTTSVNFFREKYKCSNDYTFTFCLVYKNQGKNKATQRYKHQVQDKKCCGLDDENKNEHNSFYKHIITKDIAYYKKEFSELKC